MSDGAGWFSLDAPPGRDVVVVYYSNMRGAIRLVLGSSTHELLPDLRFDTSVNGDDDVRIAYPSAWQRN